MSLSVMLEKYCLANIRGSGTGIYRLRLKWSADTCRITVFAQGRNALQESETEPADLARIGGLLLRLLSAEEICRRALEADAEQREMLRAFQKEKRTRKG